MVANSHPVRSLAWNQLPSPLLSKPPSPLPTLSEKLEYLFFSPRIFQCYFMNIHNKYFGEIFSALCVDVFPELFRIFPNFDFLWYMTKDSEVHLKNCLLIEDGSFSLLMAWLIWWIEYLHPTQEVQGSNLGGEPFFDISIKPLNIPKCIANN